MSLVHNTNNEVNYIAPGVVTLNGVNFVPCNKIKATIFTIKTFSIVRTFFDDNAREHGAGEYWRRQQP